MEKIRLSKTEKRMMLMLSEYGAEALHDFSATEASIAVRSLQHKGLAKGAFIEGGLLESATISALGRSYLRQNPSLRNPINWSKVSAIASIIMAIIAIIALLIGCSIIR